MQKRSKKPLSEKDIDDAWREVQGRPVTHTEPNDDFLASMMQDADELEQALPEGSKLDQLTKDINRMIELEKLIDKKKEEMNLLIEEYEKLEKVTIPDTFDEVGMKKFSLIDGTEVAVVRDYACTITEENKPAAFKWLADNGHDAIIKHDVIVKLKKGEKELYEDVKKDLELLGAVYDDKEYVHFQTLKAFVKEQLSKSNSNLPQEVFGVFPLRFTKIKKP